MARPVLTICVRCEPEAGGPGGDALFAQVKALRKAYGLKRVFKLEKTRCLHLCRWACSAMLEGKRRSSYQRCELHGAADAEPLVAAAVAYASLSPGQELSERQLPGASAD
ncbi:MAG: DUF1636 family protein [Myxococcaceae bacterium]|nr:DUF1636 family protein [Myxococcaceae bacterium]